MLRRNRLLIAASSIVAAEGMFGWSQLFLGRLEDGTSICFDDGMLPGRHFEDLN